MFETFYWNLLVAALVLAAYALVADAPTEQEAAEAVAADVRQARADALAARKAARATP